MFYSPSVCFFYFSGFAAVLLRMLVFFSLSIKPVQTPVKLSKENYKVLFTFGFPAFPSFTIWFSLISFAHVLLIFLFLLLTLVAS